MGDDVCVCEQVDRRREQKFTFRQLYDMEKILKMKDPSRPGPSIPSSISPLIHPSPYPSIIYPFTGRA